MPKGHIIIITNGIICQARRRKERCSKQITPQKSRSWVTPSRKRKTWHPKRVRQCCIDNQWYTRGTNKDYEEMLDYVRDTKPTIENIFTVAKDIYDHSDFDSRFDTEDEVVEAIMFTLNREAIVTSYFIE